MLRKRLLAVNGVSLRVQPKNEDLLLPIFTEAMML